MKQLWELSAREHLQRAGLLLLLLLSPVGAPMIGLMMLSICPEDKTVIPDGPFAMPFADCGVSHSVEHLYQNAFALALLPMPYFGGFIGFVMTILWAVAGLVTAFVMIRHAFLALADVIV